MNIQPKQSKYTAAMIVEMYRLVKDGVTKKAVADQYGIDNSSVHMIWNTANKYLSGERQLTDQTSDAWTDAVAILKAQPDAVAPEIVPVPEVIVASPVTTGEILSTTDYDQFKRVAGNRDILPSFVEKLVAAIAVENLLPNYPLLVSRDGYLLDGQHRREAARKLHLPVFYTVSPLVLKDAIVARINRLQHSWNTSDYIRHYAERGNEQFQFLQDIMDAHKVRPNVIIELFNLSALGVRTGILEVYRTDAAREALVGDIEDYLVIREMLPLEVRTHGKLLRALRILLKQEKAKNIIAELQGWKKEFVYKRTHEDYLRQFEEVFNYRKSEENYKRFF